METSDEFPIRKEIRRGMDKNRNRYPFCIVWTPLPVISWILPIIGHTGICTSEGIIHDFAGSFEIGVNDMAFGNPHKYVQLNPNQNEQEIWNEAVAKSDDKFRREEHNIFTNNCHSHVAHALNMMKYNGNENYNIISIWWMCLKNSKYVSFGHIVKTYLGFIILCGLLLFWTQFLKR